MTDGGQSVRFGPGRVPASPVARPVRSLLFVVLFLGFTALFGLTASPILVLPRRFAVAVGRFWSRCCVNLFCWTLGASLEVRGLDRLPSSPCLICSKHQSVMETLVLVALVPDAAFLLKRELTWIPIYGWYLMRLRMPSINRSAGVSALHAMVRAAQKAVDEGRPVVIFPEGTRTPPGGEVRWRGGAAALAAELSTQVAPVALNTGVGWPKRPWVKCSARLVVEVLPLRAPLERGGDKRAFLQALAQDVEAASRRLEAEAGFGGDLPASAPGAAGRQA